MKPFHIMKNTPPLDQMIAAPHPKTIYPFDMMKVGDSFQAPRDLGVNKAGKDKRQINILSAVAGWKKRRNKPDVKFSTRLLNAETVICRRDK